MPYDLNTFATVTANHNDHENRSSEEAIIHRGASDAAPLADDASREDRLQIRTTTTVKVESHKLDDGDDNDDNSDLSHRL